MDFAKAIENAQKLPAGSDTGPRNFFDPDGSAVRHVAQVADSPSAVPGTAKYNLEYHAQRFYMGRELAEVTEDGAKIYQDRDESENLQDVMNMVLSGEAVLLNRIQQILTDGSVVMFVEWTTKKVVAPTERNYATKEELTSPQRITDRSKAADAGQPLNLVDEEAKEAKEANGPPSLPTSDPVDYDEDAGGEAANEEPDWSEPTPEE